MQQLALNIRLRDDATFGNFYPGNNQALVNFLQQFYHSTLDEFVCVWGEKSSGKTHLQHAVCRLANQNHVSTFYLSLKNVHDYEPDIFDALEEYVLICLDDIDAIVGNATWEESLFHFYNRIRIIKHKLFVTTTSAPQNLSFKLADLKSRLLWGAIFHIEKLTDTQKQQALQLHAQNRGFKLTSEVIQFLLTRCSRDMQTLFSIIEKLDQASITAKCKITLPFVKKVLGL